MTTWGFTTDRKQVPTDEQIAQLMQYVGFDKVSLFENTAILLPGMKIELGGVAKGYAVVFSVFFCALLLENTSCTNQYGGNRAR